MNSKKTLENFGKTLMQSVRDYTIHQFDATVEDKIKTGMHQKIPNKLNEFSDEDLMFIRKIAIQLVDETLHNFLWMFEQSEEYDLIESANQTSLSELSDGLSGELYTEDGWLIPAPKRYDHFIKQCVGWP